MMNSPQNLSRHHPAHSAHHTVNPPTPLASPVFARGAHKYPSPENTPDVARDALEALASTDASGSLGNVQYYPIRSRRPGYDPLENGIAQIGAELSLTLLPLLQVPMPKGRENIVNPHCRGVKGIGGPMVSADPVQNVYSVMPDNKKNVAAAQQQQSQQQYYNLQQQQQQQNTIIMQHRKQSPPQQQSQRRSSGPYQTPSYTPSPPDSKSTIELPKQTAPRESSTTIPRSIPSPTSEAPKQPKKEPQNEFKTEFRFVVNEDAKTARNTVRQHVMREFRRRERWEQGKNKVSKSKKSKKESKSSTTEQDDDVKPGQESPSLDGSFNAPSSAGGQRRGSQAMSTSGSSDASGDAETLDSLLKGRSSRKKVSRLVNGLPFNEFAGSTLQLKPEDVEDAVVEIERSELSFLPYQYDPWAEIARAQINPFSEQVSVGAGPASRALLHHYAWVMPSLMDEIVTGNVFHRIGWLYSAVAVHDPTPYHTIMGFTLGHVAMLRGMDEPAMATEHKEKSLKLIQSRLADPMLAASDGSIGSIANIAAYELIDCRPERFALHMRGLGRLVTQRGGMSDLSLNPQLETVLIRLDVIRAYVTISAPRFPNWAPVRQLTPLAINIGPPTTEWYCPPAEHHQHSYLICEDIIRLIHNIEEVLLLVRGIHPTIPFKPHPSYKELILASIVSSLRRDMLDQPATFTYHISRRVIRLAAIVLLDIAIAEFFEPYDPTSETFTSQPNAAAVSLPAPITAVPYDPSKPQPERAPGSPHAPKDKKGLGQERLRKRFPDVEQNRHEWGRSIEMMVAVLMQAERMALERPFRAWYVADIVTILMKLGDSEWQAAEEAIKGDLMGRLVEDRAFKAQCEADGVEYDSVWDLEEVLEGFWEDWHASEQS